MEWMNGLTAFTPDQIDGLGRSVREITDEAVYDCRHLIRTHSFFNRYT